MFRETLLIILILTDRLKIYIFIIFFIIFFFYFHYVLMKKIN